ncbi:hypothetical protein [Bacillus mesophilum]|uniref:Uncharacterized protein n=1 Tax=Bacillus mesophilum TaxID=1071718 RepID=A0A7V7RHY7_9BACI|nr:hypothetical protein [Bacillus mesophilum]KAB2329417.1 hypothetical protein F7732_21060 [Bacillus mesophilum]
MQFKYIGVCVIGGLIDTVFEEVDFNKAKDRLLEAYKNSGFDPHCDDARIFLNGEEVYSYEEMATCGNCGEDYPESDINMIDYEIDLCGACEKEYKNK